MIHRISGSKRSGDPDLRGKVRIGEPGAGEGVRLDVSAMPGSPIRTAVTHDPFHRRRYACPPPAFPTPRLPVLRTTHRRLSVDHGGEKFVREPSQAEPEDRHVEVDQQGGPQSGQPEVGESL